MAVTFQRETRTIPIVFTSVSDPIGAGLVTSLARPGGNLTGVLQYETGIAGKWLAMLKEIAPGLARAALLCNPSTTAYDYWLQAARAAAHTLTVELVPTPVMSAADMEQAIASFAHVPNGALLLPPDATTIIHRDVIIALAARHRLPAVYALRVFVSAGGLMAYGTNQVEQFRQAASYVDRILRGAKPADFAPIGDRLGLEGNGGGGRSHGLWRKLCRALPSRGKSCTQDPAGNEPRGPSGRASDQVRAGAEPPDREDDRYRSAADAARPRRRGDRMIGRREFITLIGGAVTWPLAARAQNRDAARRIGVLGPSSADDADYQARHSAFLQELQKLGWTIGHNLQVDYRYGAGDA